MDQLIKESKLKMKKFFSSIDPYILFAIGYVLGRALQIWGLLIAVIIAVIYIYIKHNAHDVKV